MPFNMRQNHFIYHYGPGSIIYLNGLSFMPLSMDYWLENEYFFIDRPEVTDLAIINLVKDRLQIKYDLPTIYLLTDFETRITDKKKLFNKNAIPSMIFPKYHECKKCGRIKKFEKFREIRKHIIRRKCDNLDCRKGPSSLKPLRWIKICEKGHIDDFPVLEFAHHFKEICKTPLLYIKLKGSDSSGSTFHIFCKNEQCKYHENGLLVESLPITMQNHEELKQCTGKYLEHKNPDIQSVLIREINNIDKEEIKINIDKEEDKINLEKEEEKTNIENFKCKSESKIVIRGSGNVYFSYTVSGLNLPMKKTDEEFTKFLKDSNDSEFKKLRKFLIKGKSEEDLNYMFEELFYAKKVTGNEVIELWEKVNEDLPKNEVSYRKEEFIFLSNPNLYVESPYFKANNVDIEDDFLGNYFSQIVAIQKLKVTKVLTSYSRVNRIGDQNKYSAEVIISSRNKLLFPAVDNYGEGIFFKMNMDLINKWLESSEMIERLWGLTNMSTDNSISNNILKGNKDPAIILLHSFIHGFLNQLSINAGYSTSSLSERIYYIKNEGGLELGFLIYTVESGSAGSLGGLVRKANSIELSNIIEDMINNLDWCSHDPACIDPAIDSVTKTRIDYQTGILAACHSCLFISETGCEFKNQLLDRVTLTGSKLDSRYENKGLFDL